MVLLD